MKIGYPDKWRDYGTLDVRSDDLVGNLLRAAEFEHQRHVTRTGGPVDKGEWLMTPQTVNAYYNSAHQRDHVPGRASCAGRSSIRCGSMP